MANVQWDPETNTFIAAGSSYGHREVREWIDDVVEYASEELADVTSRAMTGEITAEEFDTEFSEIVSNLQISSAVMAAGGDDQLEGDALSSLQDKLDFQLERADVFASDVSDYQDAIEAIDAGADAEEFDVISEAEALARSDLYANGGIITYENSVREREKASDIYDEESRLCMNDPMSCAGCLEWSVENAGWFPIATDIPDIGGQGIDCGPNDRCSFQYRNSQTGEEDLADEEKSLLHKNAGPHEFSVVMAEMSEDIAAQVLEVSALIPDEELEMSEGGRESQIHVTVLYGLHSANALGARSILIDQPPITIEFLGISMFAANDKHDYDVLKFDIKSDDLNRLNALLKELPHTNTFAEYAPHVTLAYVLSGKGQKWVGAANELTGKIVTIDRLLFVSSNGVDRFEIPLSGSVHEVGGLS